MNQHDSFPHRWFLGATVLFLVFTAFLSYDIYARLQPADNPLRYPVPQKIVSSTTLRAGETFLTKALKCNDSTESVLVTASSWWKRQDDQGLVAYQTGQRVLDPGCTSVVFTNTTPATLVPGLWRLEGRECYKPDICRNWVTDTFRIIP